MKKGKAYANKKKKEDRPRGDFYNTPKSLIWVSEDIIKREFNHSFYIFNPCCGLSSITEELRFYGYDVIENDLYGDPNKSYCEDYLQIKTDMVGMRYNKRIITNPPFLLWDKFVEKAKTHCKKFMFIGRLNYLGTNSRFKSGIWENLKLILPFNRYVDFQTPYRKDGHFHVGAMATAWFLWDMNYFGKPEMEILDVQKYATLGNYKEGLYER